MLSTPTLPEGYREIYSVNLQKDKKVMLLLNLFSLLIGAALIVPVLFFKPISALFSMEKGMGSYLLIFAAIIVFSVVYLVLHELVHGVAMKLCGTKKVKYGFTGLYAFAGSTDFYGKGAYIFIALAPVVFWGIILAVLCQFASILGYHAYLTMRWLLTMDYGAVALILVLLAMLIIFIRELFLTQPKKKKRH